MTDSRDEEVIWAFVMEKPTHRILINAPSSQGAVGFGTGLVPSMTLGCGAFGGNITSDNISAHNLVLTKHVGYVYDGFERLCKRIDPEAGGTLFQYDGVGNLIASTQQVNAGHSALQRHLEESKKEADALREELPAPEAIGAVGERAVLQPGDGGVLVFVEIGRAHV